MQFLAKILNDLFKTLIVIAKTITLKVGNKKFSNYIIIQK